MDSTSEMSWSVKCVKVTQKDIFFMVYFKFLSEITDIGLNQFQRVWSEVYSMDQRFSPLAAQLCERNSSFKIRTGDVRLQRGGKKYPQKN